VHEVRPLLAWFNAALRHQLAPLLATAFPEAGGDERR
jgi:hypothetical protein